MSAAKEIIFEPQGKFDLLYQNKFFNGWPTLSSDDNTIVMAIMLEDWSGPAAVTLKQEEVNGPLTIKVYGTTKTELATSQAIAALSLDVDGRGWDDLSKKDSVMGEFQKKYHFIRPSLFNTPYEAAAGFMIGHRITIPQARRIRAEMAQQIGEKITVEGEDFYAFPAPQKLLELQSFKSLNETKIVRLRAVAEAALAGKLAREHLRSMPVDQALAELETLPGVGPFFSQGILYRGAGIVDGMTSDDMSKHGVKAAYNLPEDASSQQIAEITDKWRPYGMWAIVLIHIWLRETNNFPKRTFSKK